ncbi:hypothetical protein XH93_10320 [Bradyrhizobium sp. CCBAU 51753]|nr:hypothetical protein XH93_10320 [Bradyrhizobium sp. CCBAU 51753]
MLVGVANAAFGYALFALLYLLLGSHQLAITLATACGVVFNFHSTGKLVFRNRRISALPPFVAGCAVVWLVNIMLLNELTTTLAMSPLTGQSLALPFLALLSYVINRYLVFGRPDKDEPLCFNEEQSTKDANDDAERLRPRQAARMHPATDPPSCSSNRNQDDGQDSSDVR